MFEIEKNIPITSKNAYPFDSMQHGDSFLIPCDQKKDLYVRGQINSLKKYYPNKIIATRKVSNGLRVWLLNKG